MTTIITASRYHDISCGHRVVGHESKCALLHGHNYRIHFDCAAEALDQVGRVLDFSSIKDRLCMWLEREWDHHFLAWEQDEIVREIVLSKHSGQFGVVFVPFNPTAENMALYLLHTIAPQQLAGTGVRCVGVRVEETRKCSAAAVEAP